LCATLPRRTPALIDLKQRRLFPMRFRTANNVGNHSKVAGLKGLGHQMD
jgi:hypothetical protein